MIKTRHFLGAALLLAILPLSASAQAAAAKIVAGKWTGSVSPPGAGELPMSYEVKTPGDSIQITATLSMEGQSMNFAFANAKFADNTLTFNFDAMGSQIGCALKAETDGSWVGECKDPSGSPAVMKMIPPKKEGGLDI